MNKQMTLKDLLLLSLIIPVKYHPECRKMLEDREIDIKNSTIYKKYMRKKYGL